MRTYGKNKPSKFGSGITYTSATIDSPEDQKDWSLSSSSVASNKTARPTALHDRGQASLNDDMNIRTDSKTFAKDKLGGKRSRCPLVEVVKGGDWKDLQYLLEQILAFNKNPALSGGTLFVRVPDSWPYENVSRFVNWLVQLGFREDFLGPVAGYKYPKEEVINYYSISIYFFSTIFCYFDLYLFVFYFFFSLQSCTIFTYSAIIYLP